MDPRERTRREADRLSPAQARLLGRLGRTQRWTAALGLVLALAGAAYAVWGVGRFDPAADPRDDPGFDRPVARLAFVFDVHRRRFAQIRPETFTEKVLMQSLEGGMRLSASFTMLLLRLFLGTLALVGGLVMLTVVVERRRLLQIIAQLGAQPEPGAPRS